MDCPTLAANLANANSEERASISEHSMVKDEQALITGARQFDLKALEIIYDEFNDPLFRYAYRLLGNRDVAEECVAETFSRFLQTLKKGHGPKEHLRAYLYRMAHNWISNYYKRQPPPAISLEDRADLEIPGGHDTVEQVEHNQQRAWVRAALAHLTEEQRQVIVLKYLEGWSNQEVADSLGKPVGAIKSLQHRALAAFERMLESEVSEASR